MKKYMISAILFLLIFFNVYDLISQEVIMPDQQIQCAVNDARWTENATVFCNYNGNLYMFVWTPEFHINLENFYPYVYKYTDTGFQPFLVNGTNKLKFGYDYEDHYNYQEGVFNFIVYGKPMAFSYYGEMWFYSRTHFWNPYAGGWVYLDLWAQYDEDQGWRTWYTQMQDLPAELNMGACPVDSNLRIIAYNTTTKKFIANEYMFNSISKNIDYQISCDLPLIGDRLEGVFTYKDSDSNNCFIYDTYFEETGQLQLTFNSPVLGYLPIGAVGNAGSSALLQGSLQGMRTNESHHPEKSNRFNFFYIGKDKISNGAYPLFVQEWALPAGPTAIPELISFHNIILPTSAYPDKINQELYLQSSTLMTPTHFSSPDSTPDGLTQQLIIFYPDSKRIINGSFFNSDFWRPVPGSSVSSLDLANDEIYGPQIRKLWTLIGIVDGAPPCSINWPVWEENHFTDEPTELSFTVEDVSSSEVTSSYEDTYSLGGKIETKFSKLMSDEVSFKYANTYKSTVSSKNTIKSSLSTNFGLNEHSQELGYLIWNIPQITRTSYQVYPWYDKNLVYPVSNSLQYQFRTLGVMTVTENIEISKFPFLIDEPNGPNLDDWKANHRQEMYNNISGYGLSPLKSISWTNPNAGQVFNFSQTNTNTSSVETSNSYSWGIGESATIPEVFKISGSYDQDISYSAENTYETELGTEVEFSLKNLTDKVYGINISYYDMSIFWFKPNVAHWWYLDSMSGQTPWYIAYLVGTVHSSIAQLSPGQGSRVGTPDLLFSWKAENGELSDYKLYISTEPQAGPGSTIYQVSCGNRTSLSLKDFVLEPGKNYYWTVMGLAPGGEPVWSDSRAFMVINYESLLQAGTGMKASIYPNPQKDDDFFVTFELTEPGKVKFTLYESNGRLIYQDNESYPSKGIFTRIIPTDGIAPGIYFLEINSDREGVTKKIIKVK